LSRSTGLASATWGTNAPDTISSSGGKEEAGVERARESRRARPSNLRGGSASSSRHEERDVRLSLAQWGQPYGKKMKTVIEVSPAFVAEHADPTRLIETVSQDFWRSVMSCDWRGNVRELENFVARCIALVSGPTLRDEDGCLISKENGDSILAKQDTKRLDVMAR